MAFFTAKAAAAAAMTSKPVTTFSGNKKIGKVKGKNSGLKASFRSRCHSLQGQSAKLLSFKSSTITGGVSNILFAGKGSTKGFPSTSFGRMRCVAGLSAEEMSAKVRWMPNLQFTGGMSQVFEDDNAEEADSGKNVIPFFPLGVGYIPGTTQILNIFEPRYRQMYNDILFNGSRRFCVSMVSKDGQFAEVGVVFYLKDLKEVSEQTGDQIKFICEHEVMGRVKLKRVVNPDDWRTRASYLKVEVEDMVDTDAEEDTSKLEEELTEVFNSIMYMQMTVGQDVRFNDMAEGALEVGRSDSGGLWKTVQLWQDFCHQRLVSIQQDAQKQIQELLMPFIQESEKTAQGQYVVNFENLPVNVKSELKRIQDTGNEEMQQLMADPYLPFQILLQTESHSERLKMLTEMVQEEQKRLQARVSLKALFDSKDP